MPFELPVTSAGVAPGWPDQIADLLPVVSRLPLVALKWTDRHVFRTEWILENRDQTTLSPVAGVRHSAQVSGVAFDKPEVTLDRTKVRKGLSVPRIDDAQDPVGVDIAP